MVLRNDCLAVYRTMVTQAANMTNLELLDDAHDANDRDH
jgi:hypothetical protein